MSQALRVGRNAKDGIIRQNQDNLYFEGNLLLTLNYFGPLFGFAAFKNHCSFYIMSSKVMNVFKEGLKPYDTAKAKIRFSTGKPLPELLVKKIVKARIEENEDKKKINKSKK